MDGVRIRKAARLEVKISGITNDSRKVKHGFAFIAYKGVAVDGHEYIESAIANGATVIVVEDDKYYKEDSAVSYVLIDKVQKSVSLMASNFYNRPTKKLSVIGITGTNGKTTVATMLWKLLTRLGYKAGLVSTVDIRVGDKVYPSVLTTPDPVDLQRIFYDMTLEDVTHVAMEVSSHALDQGRVESIDFDVAVFTNITHDHLDYHKTFAEYIKAKKMLFDKLSPKAYALTNLDDKNGNVMVQNCGAVKRNYALKRPADYKSRIISNDINGLHMTVQDQEVFLRVIGEFNAYNTLAVYGVSDILGMDQVEVLRVISSIDSAEGRMDVVAGIKKECTAIIDYAHTPDALEKVLLTIRSIRKKNQSIITVVGAGGDRDRSKRPKMAAIANRYSDKVILTSDNPRSEDPEEILKEMLQGVEGSDKEGVAVVTNRKEAIKLSSMLAQENDIILIAGKGHEKYQEIMGQRYPFDDKEIIRALLC